MVFAQPYRIPTPARVLPTNHPLSICRHLATGGPDSPTILPTQRRLASIVEMIHVASLLHDDVTTPRACVVVSPRHQRRLATSCRFCRVTSFSAVRRSPSRVSEATRSSSSWPRRSPTLSRARSFSSVPLQACDRAHQRRL
jgi:diadenosine tetraphosphatase ApaH/serine/threonine PP2A family protein phosphatase